MFEPPIKRNLFPCFLTGPIPFFCQFAVIIWPTKAIDEEMSAETFRQIRQIWSYIESQILDGKYVKDGEGKDVSPGIIFPKQPKDKERTELIERMFEEEGIPVVWHDETIEERKMR